MSARLKRPEPLAPEAGYHLNADGARSAARSLEDGSQSRSLTLSARLKRPEPLAPEAGYLSKC
ncbi:hypothetical protein MKX79_20280 [Viridibacillus sp. FSL R5-0468]|uniref:hypothetical protein n=1 Tax=Viridibacillus sp. FSL R5-0468 TaxID=2921640 RepID=UPI0030FA315F